MTKCEDVTILPWTRYTRRVSFRSDDIGLYLLLWEDPEGICGVVSYQYPSACGDFFMPGFSAEYWGDDYPES